jgi:hypothetical protein
VCEHEDARREGRQEESKLGAFVNNPHERNTIMWVNPLTNELVAHCIVCDAEARHQPEELADFHFQHEAWCLAAAGVAAGQA